MYMSENIIFLSTTIPAVPAMRKRRKLFNIFYVYVQSFGFVSDHGRVGLKISSVHHIVTSLTDLRNLLMANIFYGILNIT